MVGAILLHIAVPPLTGRSFAKDAVTRAGTGGASVLHAGHRHPAQSVRTVFRVQGRLRHSRRRRRNPRWRQRGKRGLPSLPLRRRERHRWHGGAGSGADRVRCHCPSRRRLSLRRLPSDHLGVLPGQQGRQGLHGR